MAEANKGTAVIKKSRIDHYNRLSNDAIRAFKKRIKIKSSSRKNTQGYLMPKRKTTTETKIDSATELLAMQTVSPRDGSKEKSTCCPHRNKSLTWKMAKTEEFTEDKKHYIVDKKAKAFVVIAPPALTATLKQFLYSQGGLMQFVDAQLEQIKQECNNETKSDLRVDRPVEFSPDMCHEAECTFVSKPIFMRKEDDTEKQKNFFDLAYIMISPKGLQDSKWMVGLMRQLRLDEFLKHVNNAVKELERIDEYDAVVLSQSILCVPYYCENNNRTFCEHIDGLPTTTPQNNLYSVSLPLTLLQNSPPEFHLITGKTILKYKFKPNHALFFAANQGHSTANFSTCGWLPPNNVRVMLMLVVGDRNYLTTQPTFYKEQVIEMSDPCYPCPPEDNSGAGNQSGVVAARDAQWTAYEEEWITAYDESKDYFEKCMEN